LVREIIHSIPSVNEIAMNNKVKTDLTLIVRYTISLITSILIFVNTFSQTNCPNSNFGSGNFNNWEGYFGTFSQPALIPGLDETRHVINIDQGVYDPYTNNGLLTIPPGEQFSAKLGNNNVNSEAEQLRYTLTVTPESNLFIYKYAVVLQDPGHIYYQQPSFTIEVKNENGVLFDSICGYYYVYAQQGMPGWNSTGSVVWKDWTTVGINLDPYLGEEVTIVFTTRDCDQGGHFGYAYISATCATLQMSISYCPENNFATMTAPAGFNYLWETGDENQSLIIDDPNPGDVISCLLTAFNGCEVTISALVSPTIVNADFEYILGCVNKPVEFHSISSTNQNVLDNFIWNFGDGSQAVSDSSNIEFIYDQSDTYDVQLIAYSSDGCSDTITKSISLFPQPHSDFTYPTHCYVDSLQFFDNSSISQGEILNWNWTIEDGTNLVYDNLNPVHHFNAPGSYNVMLVTSSADNCHDTIIKKVEIFPNPDIELTRNNEIIPNDTNILCPYDTSSVIKVNDCGVEYIWTKKTKPDWLLYDQSVLVSNPGMGGFFETYYLLVINEFGCNSKDTTFIIWDFGSCSENSPENDHVIFPNPSSGLLNIEIKDLPVSFTIEIYDSQGTIAYKQDFKNLTTKMLYIDCSNLAKGNYFINISGDNYSSISQIVFY